MGSTKNGAPLSPAGRRESRERRRLTRRKTGIIAAAVAVVLAVGGVGAANLLRSPSGPAAQHSVSPGRAGGPGMTGAPPVGPSYRQAGPPAGSPLKPVEPLTVTLSGAETGTELRKGLVGLSLELTDLALPSLSSDDTSMVGLLKALHGPMLRFGGNSVERRAFWTSTGEAVPSWAKGSQTQPAAVITPADLVRLKGLLDATDSTAAIVVDLAHLEPGRAADFVKHAHDILGARFLGYTPGNEPNGYEANKMRPPGWGEQGYLEDARSYADAIAKAAPGVPIIGPGTYAMTWGRSFAAADLPEQKIYAFHHYPFSSCDGTEPGSKPTIENLLRRSARDGSIGFRERMMAPARQNKLPVWIPEAGTSACPGYQNSTTKTHASALWTVDYSLSSAQLGIERVGFHSSLAACQGGPSMSAVCNTGTLADPSQDFSVRANFWGESFVAQLPVGRFLTAETHGDQMSYVYAIRSDDDELSLVVINTNDPTTAAQTAVSIKLPFSASRGTMAQLTGPSYAAQDATLSDGRKAPLTPAAKRPGIPGFTGGDSLELPLTAGTATVLTFTK